MTGSSYTDALDYLFARTTGTVRFGLERTTELLEYLGNPHRKVPAVHIAGTNGKGSTVATTVALLRGRGLGVAAYTSPHLVDFRERIAVDGVPISEAAVVEFIRRHTDVIERIGATFFEATTALAFDYFAQAGATVSVIETGLGGRLDSTNVIDPLVATVTSIGRDHTEYLGDSLELIAREKAGIFKRGRPAVIGEQDPAVRSILLQCANDAGASRVWMLGDDLSIDGIETTGAGTRFDVRSGAGRSRWTTPLIGAHQAANAALAWLSLEAAGDPYRLPLEAAAAPLARVSLPGRFERIGKHIFDVAHNRAGSEVLSATMAQLAPEQPVVAVFCALADKDWQGMISALSPAVQLFVLTNAPTAPANRGWSTDAALSFARANRIPALVTDDFGDALQVANARGKTVLVTGSFHTVGDAMSRLQLSPLARYL